MLIRMIPKDLWDKWNDWDKEHNDRIGILIERFNNHGIECYRVKQIKPPCKKGYEKKIYRVDECQIIE